MVQSIRIWLQKNPIILFPSNFVIAFAVRAQKKPIRIENRAQRARCAISKDAEIDP